MRLILLALFHSWPGEKTGVGWGVPPDQSAAAYSDLRSLFRAVFLGFRCVEGRGSPDNFVIMLMDDDISDEAHLGPKMRRLTERQRRFVLAALNFPTAKGWQLARAAGYPTKSHGYLRLAAHRNLHNEDVLEALHEEAGKRLRASAVLGVSVMARIAATDGHKDQLRAAEALANRVGFHETTEHRVSVEHTDRTGKAMMGRIEALAARLGMDAAALLGANAPLENAPPRLIEGEVVRADHQD